MPVPCLSQSSYHVASFLTGVLPQGKGLVLMLRLYADESQDDASSVLRLAGYLMTSEQWGALDENIADALGELPWFHMKERDWRNHTDVYHALLKTITPSSVLAGFSVSVGTHEYLSLVSDRIGKDPLKYFLLAPYAFLVQSLLHACGDWCAEQQMNDEWIAYFFESGHPGQGEAHDLLQHFTTNGYAHMAQQAHYASHSFLPKEGPLSRALIPCDILAWHLTKRLRTGHNTPELQHLLNVPTRYQDFTADYIKDRLLQTKERLPSNAQMAEGKRRSDSK